MKCKCLIIFLKELKHSRDLYNILNKKINQNEITGRNERDWKLIFNFSIAVFKKLKL
jgi:hypothetical protein